MANGFGSLFIGVAGLQSSQNALNITSNNLANVDTEGYVRQRVIYSDRNYFTFDTTAAVSKQQSGLGVQIGDVIHTRDVFLDQSYRSTYARQEFYQTTYEAIGEVENYFQEMEGEAFQDALEDFWVSFSELSKAPDENIYQNLVVQKAQLFLSRASAVYQGLQDYQYTINTQIRDDIDRINEIGKTIYSLNEQILKIEAAGIETAMTLRDERDLLLDELSGLADVSYHETSDGILKISIEGTEFVNEARYNEMGQKTDRATGFVTPYWPHLSDENKGEYTYVFNFARDISAENQNDKGELKALVLARGDKLANYTDVEDMDKDTYNDTTGMSVMLRAEAQLDQLIHKIITGINDIFAPNTEASNLITDWDAAGTKTVYDSEGKEIIIKQDTKLLDTENCPVGSDRTLPPRELFTRIGCERYTEVTDDDGNTYYLYNEEDLSDTTKMYTLQSVNINEDLTVDESLMPHLTQEQNQKMIDQDMAEALVELWEKLGTTLNPNDSRAINFKTYYQSMIDELAIYGDIFGSTGDSLEGTVLSIDNSRQRVIGVSSDEELVSMIKFQNAYNASSRFINVINEMIETLITQLG